MKFTDMLWETTPEKFLLYLFVSDGVRFMLLFYKNIIHTSWSGVEN